MRQANDNQGDEASESDHFSRQRVHRQKEEPEQETDDVGSSADSPTSGGVGIHRSVGRDATPGESMSRDDATAGRVTYDPGPDVQRLSDRYGVDFVKDSQAEKIQRLENEHGSETVKRWVGEGMTVDTMAKPRTMRAFRERKANRSEAIPEDVERQNQASLQRNAKGETDVGPAGDAGVPDAVRSVISKPGKSMEGAFQLEMESKMGGDFSDVRLHTGSEAAAAADSINARAFTVGNHIAFNEGEYNPGSESGKKLMAHELTHVRQQTDGRVSLCPLEDGTKETIDSRYHIQPKLELTSPDDLAEKEANEVAEQVSRMDDSSANTPQEGSSQEGSPQELSRRQILPQAKKNVFRSPEADPDTIIEEANADYWVNDENEMVTGDDLREALSDGREAAIESGRAIPVSTGVEELTGYDPRDYEINEEAGWNPWSIYADADSEPRWPAEDMREAAEAAIDRQLAGMEIYDEDYHLIGVTTIFRPFKIGSSEVHDSNYLETYAVNRLETNWHDEMEVYNTPLERSKSEEGEDNSIFPSVYWEAEGVPILTNDIINVSLARMGFVLGSTDLVGFAGQHSFEQNYEVREQRAYSAHTLLNNAYMDVDGPPAVSNTLGVVGSQAMPMSQHVVENDTADGRASNRSAVLHDFFVPILPDRDDVESRVDPVDVSLLEKTMTHIRQFLGKQDGVTYEYTRDEDETVSIDFDIVDEGIGPYGNIDESADLGDTLSEHTDANEQFYHSLHNLLELYMSSNALPYHSEADVDRILCECYDENFELEPEEWSRSWDFKSGDTPEPREIHDLAYERNYQSFAYTDLDRLFGRADTIEEVITGIESAYEQAILGLHRVGRHSENMEVGRNTSPPSVLGQVLDQIANQRSRTFLGLAMEWFEAADVTLPGDPITDSTWPVDACQ